LKNTKDRSQRSFVVEYKSSRRQNKVSASSIWGNTNLKAIAQAVAEDLPIGQFQSDDRAPSAAVTPTIKTVSNIQDRPPASLSEPDVISGEPASPVRVIPDETGAAAVDNPIIDTKREEGPARSTQHNRLVKRKAVVPIGRQQTAVLITDDDSLSALELENNRLRRLLIERLKSENERLTEMLARLSH
jgi:hypothetical protein